MRLQTEAEIRKSTEVLKIYHRPNMVLFLQLPFYMTYNNRYIHTVTLKFGKNIKTNTSGMSIHVVKSHLKKYDKILINSKNT